MKEKDSNVLKFHGKPVAGVEEYQLHLPPSIQSVLMIGGQSGVLEFYLAMPVPNRWRRYWHWVFFGFTWKEYKG